MIFFLKNTTITDVKYMHTHSTLLSTACVSSCFQAHKQVGYLRHPQLTILQGQIFQFTVPFFLIIDTLDDDKSTHAEKTFDATPYYEQNQQVLM